DAAIRLLMPPQSATGDNETCGQTETAGTNPAPAVMLPEAYLPVRTAAIHLGKLRLRQIGQLAKSGAIMRRQVCQHLAIHLNVRPLQPVDKAAVVQAGLTCGRVDADNPQAAEIALAVAPVAVRIEQGFEHCLVRPAEEATARAKLPLG